MCNYVGILYQGLPPHQAARQVFENDSAELKYDAMRPKYDQVIGPFRSRAGAEYLAKHWFEPVCCTVDEAERMVIYNNVPLVIIFALLQFCFLAVATLIAVTG